MAKNDFYNGVFFLSHKMRKKNERVAKAAYFVQPLHCQPENTLTEVISLKMQQLSLESHVPIETQDISRYFETVAVS